MKLIIAGGRDFTDYTYMKDSLLSICILDRATEIVWGGAQGADTLGKRIASEFRLPDKLFPANWEELGKAAGIIRNHQMGDYADELVAFWDTKSRGTADMIQYMKRLGKPVYVFTYTKREPVVPFELEQFFV